MELKDETIKFLNKHIRKDLTGKLVVITGATSGVGLNAARELLYLKCSLILAVRNEEKGLGVKEDLLKEFPDSSIDIYPLDLASLDSIKKFAMKVKRNKLDIYAFINNAGFYSLDNEKTMDSYPLTFGTNYIGTYSLTERLLPYFKTLPHDVILVNTSSIAYKRGRIHESCFTYNEKKYDAMRTYASSKLAITRYSIYLANILMDSNVRVVMSHPGVAKTKMVDSIASRGIRKIGHPFLFVFQEPEKSALSILYAIGNEWKPGTLLGPKRFFGFKGNPKVCHLKKTAYKDLTSLIKMTDKYLG